MNTKIRIILKSLTTGLGLAAFAFLLMPASFVSASDVTAGKLIELANQSRAAAGEEPLTENALLSAAAAAKAEDMLKNDYFGHTSPAGVKPWHWVTEAGYGYQYAGENLAINYHEAEAQHQAWMESPTHRANILSPRYTEIGIAVVSGTVKGKESLITVQMFGAPRAGAAMPKREAAPQPAAAPAVQGVEAESPVQAAPQEPVTAAPLLWMDYAWMGSIILIQLLMLAAPMAFTVRAVKRLRELFAASRSLLAAAPKIVPPAAPPSGNLHGRGVV